MQQTFRGEVYRTTVICIDSYEQGVMAGRFYHAEQKEGVVFHSLTQLLVGMEHKLNTVNCPQSYTAMRFFAPAAEAALEESAETRQRRGALATFAVKVLFRQHTSWQGSVVWVEEKREQSFRSVLELILLMDSALSEGQEEQVS